MNRKEIEELTREIALQIVEDYGFELVDVEFVKEGSQRFLRVFIDKVGGITIEDCQKVSERLSDKLDEIDPIEENYYLEVSSPGLDRPLKTESDYKKSLGKEVEISLYKPIEGKKKFIGKLKDYNETTVTIELEQGSLITINKKDLAKINLAVIF
ncbi:ribosome maturation factor RimP [Caloranaerobacter azorensis]|uniref:Ribosome maturation factor RimP n=2 Tax=Caloranaerobacter azorensis TaxID=116090 RepID=A0A1M5UX27_9FIRM|nr:ribosome maturation factor RimP [Caloranaerobacter azorensis]QIB26153.1 ribosome maturation factor RimP [Caloranaerobacter azorensis]SHH67480.1 ribosome maturation factor RimP [Caloranaerobacter azorensis DSM 13643]